MMRFFWMTFLPLSAAGGAAALLLWLARPALRRFAHIQWSVPVLTAALCLFVLPLPVFAMPGAWNAPAQAVQSSVGAVLSAGAAASEPLFVMTELPPAADKLLDLLRTDDPMGALEAYRGHNELLDTGIDELSTVVRYMAAFGVPQDHFMVDLTIARGLDYYTGTVYETVMLDHPEIGSICSGGRYDNLAEYYTDKKLPGVGISIGLTRLFYVLGEQGYLNDQLVTAPADVLILPMTEDLSPAIAFATQLRQGGVRAQVYSEQKKFKGKMSYADKLHIPYVAFLGEEEISQGLVKIKDMATGDQQALSPAQAVETIAAAMAHRAQGKPIREKG